MPNLLDGWYRAPIREMLSDEFPGEWGAEPDGTNGTATVLRATDLDDDGHVNYGGGALRAIPEAKQRAKRLRCGDILLEASGGGPGKPVGRVAIFDGRDDRDYLTSNFFRTLRPNAGAVPRFLLWRLMLCLNDPRIWSFQQQTTGITNLKVREYLAQEITWPTPVEQRRIAEILDTADEAIQKTEALIAKLKQMKAGLLHDLLTRGLGDHGQLRDAVAHPEQFKDSPLGCVPKTWEMRCLREVVPTVDYGVSVPLDDDFGTPVLRMNNLRDGEVSLDDLRYTRRHEAAALILKPLDVLFNRTNSIEHVGRTAIWRGQLARVSFASYLVRLNADRTRLDPRYLNLWLNLPATQLAVRRLATPAVQQVNINPTRLRAIFICMPGSMREQANIAAVMAAHDARICAEEQDRDKLKQIKKGLMHDLLTGRVRVQNTGRSDS